MDGPIIILGAARSGTRLLRSIVASSDEIPQIECDVNYIWRYGNEQSEHDALPPESITPRIATFISRYLSSCAGVAQRLPFVEKTVSNVLRIPFVRQIYPEARFIHLVRDGRDVIESAMRCWSSPPSLNHLARKLGTFPWWHCRHYLTRYLCQIGRRSLGLSSQLRSWGPRYPGIDEDVRCERLVTVCARQWVACVEAFDKAKATFAEEDLLEVKYEDLVERPANEARRIAQFINVQDQKAVIQFACHHVHRHSVRRHSRLNDDELSVIQREAGGVLSRLGYHETARAAA